MGKEFGELDHLAGIPEGNESLLELLKRMHDQTADEIEETDALLWAEDDDDDEGSSPTGLTADDYHNRAVDYSHQKQLDRAVQTCLAGLRLYPDDVDLLADTVKYSAEQGDFVTAERHYRELIRRVPKSRWNWRAFTFSFDFLVLQPDQNEDVCRELIADYYKFLPLEEKAGMAESELEEALGDYERSMAVLVETIGRLPNAPQCALRLADIQLSRGQYREVIKSTQYGLMASAEPQPSINIPYLYYLRALAQDALLHQRYAQSGSVPNGEIAELRRQYEQMLAAFPQLMSHKHNIVTRLKMMDFFPAAASEAEQQLPESEPASGVKESIQL